MKLSKRMMFTVLLSGASLALAALWLGFRSVPEVFGTSRGQAGQRIEIDPNTGAIVPASPPRGRSRAERAAEAASFNTSDEGLVEVPNPTRGGGTTVDLRGRFRSPLTATHSEDGGVAVSHGSDDRDSNGEQEGN